MKQMKRKRLLVPALLLAALLMLSACNNDNAPEETTGETGTSAPEVTTAPAIEETDPANETETDAPETLDEAQAMAIFSAACDATNQKTSGSVAMEIGMSMDGSDMGVSKVTQSFEGDNFMIVEEAEGMITEAIFLPDRVYMKATYDGETELCVVPVDEAQRAWIMTLYVSDGDESDFFVEADQFTGVTGVRMADGSVVLTAKSLSDAIYGSLVGSMNEMGDVQMTLNTCELTIDPEGLLSRMVLDMAFEASVEAEGVSVAYAFTMAMTADLSYDVTVAAPDNAAEYVEVSFDEYYMFVPNGEEAAAAGLPLHADSYTIGGEEAEISADDQFMMLLLYPSAYEGKTFTIYGIVGEDEELGVPVIMAGEYGMFYYNCAEGVTEPAYGDQVKITATFENTQDKGYDSDYSCYTMMVSACEALSKGVGPNGGTIMYVTATALNVRTSSDTSSSDNILGTLSHGDAVEVFDQDENGWWRIEFDGQTAYISNKYVSETRPE